MRFRVIYRRGERRGKHKAIISLSLSGRRHFALEAIEFEAPSIAEGIEELARLIRPGDRRPILGRQLLAHFELKDTRTKRRAQILKQTSDQR
jgi:hypothetical protein